MKKLRSIGRITTLEKALSNPCTYGVHLTEFNRGEFVMSTSGAIASLDAFLHRWKAKAGNYTGDYITTPEGLVRNNMDDEQGRGGYYQEYACTSESQVMMARGYLRAYQATGESRYLQNARTAMQALIRYFFFGKVPSTATAWRSHWIVNAGAPFKSKENGRTTDTIAFGEAYECWPTWRKLRPNEFATAGDSMHWFIENFHLFSQLETEDQKGQWLAARDAMFREFKLLLSPKWQAKYKGAIPFEYTNKGDNLTVRSTSIFRGPYYTGYQNPLPWLYMQDYTAAANMLQLLVESQVAYTKSTGVKGPFAPVYHYDASLLGSAKKNVFTWNGPDPNTFWGGFQYRPFADVAHFWYHCKRSNIQNAAVSNASKVCMSFLSWLDGWLTAHPNNEYVPTEFREATQPSAPPANGDNDPHMIALALKGALFCKNAGADAAMVGRVIARLYAMVMKRQSKAGDMAGAFMHDPYSHIFKGFWAGDIMEALALYIMHHEKG